MVATPSFIKQQTTYDLSSVDRSNSYIGLGIEGGIHEPQAVFYPSDSEIFYLLAKNRITTHLPQAASNVDTGLHAERSILH